MAWCFVRPEIVEWEEEEEEVGFDFLEGEVVLVVEGEERFKVKGIRMEETEGLGEGRLGSEEGEKSRRRERGEGGRESKIADLEI